MSMPDAADESASAPGRSGLPRALRGPGQALAAAYFVLLVIRNAGRLIHPIYEASDFAANSMLIDRAERLEQLTGNYSRVHFHHPGPAFLYVGAIGQAVFHQLLHVVPADFNGQLIAYFGLNAVMAGLVVATLRRHIDSDPACIVGVTVMLLWLDQHVAIAVPWPPYYYVMPFLLLAVAAPSVVVGELRSLPTYAIAAGFLVHGHASFLMFVGVTTFVVVAAWLVVHRGRRRSSLAAARRQVRWSAGIVGLFLLPLVIDLILHWPGQWVLYWRYSRQASTNPIHGVLTYVGHFWTASSLGWLGFLLAIAVCIGLAVPLATGVQRYLLTLAGFVLLLVACVTFYAYRGVDDLTQLYTGDFSTALPGLVLGVAAMLVAQRLLLLGSRPWPVVRVRVVSGVAAVAGAGLVLSGTGMAAVLSVYTRTPSDLAQLKAMAAPGQAVILDIPHVGATWPKAFALLEAAHRIGQPVCLTDPQWQFLAAPAIDCTPHEAATGLHVAALYVGPTVKRLTTVTWSGGRLQLTKA